MVQAISDTHWALSPVGTRGFSLGIERQGREGDHSPPTSAEVKKTWIYTSTFPYVSMAYCLIS
jgi:hypothetical protein